MDWFSDDAYTRTKLDEGFKKNNITYTKILTYSRNYITVLGVLQSNLEAFFQLTLPQSYSSPIIE